MHEVLRAFPGHATRIATTFTEIRMNFFLENVSGSTEKPRPGFPGQAAFSLRAASISMSFAAIG